VPPAAYCARVTRPADPCDVLVIGAGPAGSTAAQLLASWGWSVVVAHRDHRAPAAHPTLSRRASTTSCRGCQPLELRARGGAFAELFHG
jgi:2-polyprenyl-6-methoxyphenol hydroxylase-like FAD-dependent oxidoreductase